MLVDDDVGQKSHRLVSVHHDVSSNYRVINEVLSAVDGTI